MIVFNRECFVSPFWLWPEVSWFCRDDASKFRHDSEHQVFICLQWLKTQQQPFRTFSKPSYLLPRGPLQPDNSCRIRRPSYLNLYGRWCSRTCYKGKIRDLRLFTVKTRDETNSSTTKKGTHVALLRAVAAGFDSTNSPWQRRSRRPPSSAIWSPRWATSSATRTLKYTSGTVKRKKPTGFGLKRKPANKTDDKHYCSNQLTQRLWTMNEAKHKQVPPLNRFIVHWQSSSWTPTIADVQNRFKKSWIKKKKNSWTCS